MACGAPNTNAGDGGPNDAAADSTRDEGVTRDALLEEPSETADAAVVDEARLDDAVLVDDVIEPLDARDDGGAMLESDVGVDTRRDEGASLDVAADAALGPVAQCPVRDLRELYAGLLPTNPYAAQPAATPCVAREHDVIIVLGCPNNADGSPATCQNRRADMAVAMQRAGLGQRFITSGAAVHNAYVEAETLANLLVARGVSRDDIVLEPRALHTDENVYYSSLLMQSRGWSTALVVSEDPGHLVMSAVCDANCCVRLGRLTVFSFDVGGRGMVAGHYVLAPPASNASSAECAQIQLPTKLMCTNLSSRNACAGRLRL